jgi:hypothetical protein
MKVKIKNIFILNNLRYCKIITLSEFINNLRPLQGNKQCFCYSIASEQPPHVIASEHSERSNPPRTPNNNRDVQWGDCFTPIHLPTLRFAMTGWSNGEIASSLRSSQ